MKNKLIICFILMVVCIPFVGSISVSADSEKTEKNKFIYSTLSDFLDIQNIDFDNNISISEPFDVFDFDHESQIMNKELYFVSSNNNLIGLLSIDYVNQEYQANFSEISDEVLNDLYQNNVAFVYGLHNDIAVVWYENVFHSLDNDAVYDLTFNQDMYFPKTIEADVNLKSNYPLYAVQSNITPYSSTVYNKQLSNISIVKNGSSPSGKGLCWAATMAMKINRESPSWSNMDVDDVFWNMRIMFSEDPVGTIEWYKKGYPRFGLSNLSYKRNGLSTSETSIVIQNDKAIHIDVSNSSTKTAHAVLIGGITIYSDHAIYTIYDSNKSQKCYQYVTDKAMSDYNYFVYNASSSTTYDSWYVTVY